MCLTEIWQEGRHKKLCLIVILSEQWDVLTHLQWTSQERAEIFRITQYSKLPPPLLPLPTYLVLLPYCCWDIFDFYLRVVRVWHVWACAGFQGKGGVRLPNNVKALSCDVHCRRVNISYCSDKITIKHSFLCLPSSHISVRHLYAGVKGSDDYCFLDCAESSVFVFG